jgi:hypothetical protein
MAGNLMKKLTAAGLLQKNVCITAFNYNYITFVVPIISVNNEFC